MNGEASNFFNILTNYSFNSISTMIINEEFDVNDEGYNLFRAHMMQVFVTIMGFNTILCGNIWKFWNKVRPSSEKRLLENFAKMREFGCKLLNERLQKQKVISDYELDDMIDFWIKESSGANGKYCTVDTIPDKIVLLLMAGNDAVAILAHQSLTMMALYPDVQKKVLLEITDTFPNVENIYYSDKNQLHYTSAVLDEIQRISLIQPFTLPNVNNVRKFEWSVENDVDVKQTTQDLIRGKHLFLNLCAKKRDIQ
ncbi:cytochrome P450 2J2-like protein [Leptotrombidium deliense]|uniref:Cytochrome P450 2J2-like protein n=1 Tax=Leptotrombidium deliense TaxID=299467 RepID=A0A443SJ82_9ACAR|nr:cytochrome P450 2J2-like protein [Leptotrombidium deliense]